MTTTLDMSESEDVFLNDNGFKTSLSNLSRGTVESLLDHITFQLRDTPQDSVSILLKDALTEELQDRKSIKIKSIW